MCEKVIYYHHEKSLTAAFNKPQAKLPVLLRNGKNLLLPWGNNRKRDKEQFPLGACVRLKDIHSGNYDWHFPKPVRLNLKFFFIRDNKGIGKWFELPTYKWVQGMLINEKDDMRVYIVTISENCTYPNWPRVCLGPD